MRKHRKAKQRQMANHPIRQLMWAVDAAMAKAKNHLRRRAENGKTK